MHGTIRFYAYGSLTHTHTEALCIRIRRPYAYAYGGLTHTHTEALRIRRPYAYAYGSLTHTHTEAWRQPLIIQWVRYFLRIPTKGDTALDLKTSSNFVRPRIWDLLIKGSKTLKLQRSAGQAGYWPGLIDNHKKSSEIAKVFRNKVKTR